MKKSSVIVLTLFLLVTFGIAFTVIAITPAFGAPFTAIRIGDIDGFGFGDGAGFVAANGGPVNVGGGEYWGQNRFPRLVTSCRTSTPVVAP